MKRSGARLRTGGYVERCKRCDRPLLTDEESKGVCEDCEARIGHQQREDETDPDLPRDCDL